MLEILVLNSVEIRATVRSWPQVSWRSSGGTVTLESIGFSAPLAAFYRTA